MSTVDELLPEGRSEMHLRPRWIFELDKRDALLTLKALGGRLSDEEKVLAAELGDRLTLQRAKLARDLLKGLAKAEEAVLEKRHDQGR